MKVIEVGEMPCGTKIQIECWNELYDHTAPASTIASYPIAQENMEGRYTPKRNQTFRFGLEFDSEMESRRAFKDLKRGRTKLKDYPEQVRSPELLKLL